MSTETVSGDHDKVPDDVVATWTFPLDRFKEKPIFRLVKELCIELGIPERYWADYHTMYLTKWKAVNKGIVVKGDGGKDAAKNRPTAGGEKRVSAPGIFATMMEYAKEHPLQTGIAAVLLIASGVLFKMGMWQWGAGCLPVAAVALFWSGDTMGIFMVLGAALAVGGILGGITWLIYPSAGIPVGALCAMISFWLIGKFTGI